MEENEVIETTVEEVKTETPKVEKKEKEKDGEKLGEYINKKIEKQSAKCAKSMAYVGAALGIFVIIMNMLNYFTIIFTRFGTALLALLPHMLMAVAGYVLCYLSKEKKSTKWVEWAMYLNIAAFALIWITLIWGLVI